MIIYNDKKFCNNTFSNENELEIVVKNNYEHLFGPSSLYLPKAKISTNSGAGTIPDGFAIDIENKKWYIVEAEVGAHNVWNHIAPQVTKQILASLQETTKSKLIDIAVSMYSNDQDIKEKFDELMIKEIDVRKILGSIVSSNPIIAIPIDSISDDLKDWAKTQKFEVKLWKISKYSQIGNHKEIIYEFPEEFEPSFDSNEIPLGISSGNILGREIGDITILKLLESKLLSIDQKLCIEYGPRGMKKKKYVANILEGGIINVLGQNFRSPSYAALTCINDAGSKRNTVNGWTSWKVNDSQTTLDDLRIQLTKSKTED